jgi:hypothetical protein
MFGLTPYLAAGWLASVLLVGSLAAWKATSIANDRCQVAIGKMVVESQQRKDAELAKASVEAKKVEVQDARARRTMQRIRREVDAVVARHSGALCLDDDGVRAARAAITGKSPSPAESHATVPSAAAPR